MVTRFCLEATHVAVGDVAKSLIGPVLYVFHRIIILIRLLLLFNYSLRLNLVVAFLH